MLTPHADGAVDRIAQESLTNATKHAPGAAITVRLTWTAHDLELAVSNPPSPAARARPRGAGTSSGLVGMQERAIAAGGSVEHAPTPDGGFRVVAVLPARPRDTEETP